MNLALFALLPMLVGAAPETAPASQPVASAAENASPGQVSPPAIAPEKPGTAQRPTDEQEKKPWYVLDDGTHLGVQLDVGAPGAAGLVAVFRPWWWARVNAGLAWDVIGVGARGGITLLPAKWAVTPTLNLDYGHYFSGDATTFSSGSTAAEKRLLQNAKYDFVTGQIGLEMGSQQRFIFYLRGGLSYFRASANGSDLTAVAAERAGTGTTVTFGDAKVTGLIPCFSLGFLVYVW
jgi:hypothetical protein